MTRPHPPTHQASRRSSTLIADGDCIFRAGLAVELGRREGFGEVYETGSGKEIRKLTKIWKPTRLLIDVALRGLDFRGFVRSMMSDCPDLRLVALFPPDEDARRLAQEAIQLGARGIVDKSLRSDDLLRALDRLVLGASAPRRLEAAAGPSPISDGERLSRLSRRERQIFELVADGWTTRAIAESLGITPRTVEVHRHNVVAKLEVPNTAALIKLAIRTGVTRI